MIPRPRAAYVLAGGLVAAALDITYAGAFWWLKAGVSFERILQSVAAGLVGRDSFAGGAATAALGLVLHCFNATLIAIAYALVAGRFPALRRRPVLWGGAYGLVVYAVMNYVVVPLSAAGRGSTDRLWIAVSVLVHVLFIGIPIAFAVRLAYAPPPGPATARS